MNIARIVSYLPAPLKRHKVVQLLVAVFPQSRVQLVQFNDSARVFADISDQFSRNYMLTGTFEPEFFRIAAPFLASGGTFFDVGANFGFCSFGLASCLPSCQIEYHLFEANADICRLLEKSAALYPGRQIKINQACVTNKPGGSRLHVLPGQLGSSFISNDGGEEVKNLILDQYIQEHSLTKVSLLKMDIEGHEPFALKGAERSLTSGKIEAVYIEVSAENLARSGSQPQDCLSILTESGFQLLYCKPADFNAGIAAVADRITLDVNGQAVEVARLNDFPSGHQTDILAIHKSSAVKIPPASAL